MKSLQWRLLPLFLFAASLRLIRLGRKSVWLDEAISAAFAAEPLDIIWSQHYQPHPPLYFTLLHYWQALFNQSELLIRLPSALISLVNVALLFYLGRRLFDRRIAFVAAALLAVAPLHVWYAQEARFYSLLVFVTLLMAIGLARRDVRGGLLLALGLGVGLYLNYILWAVWLGLTALWLVWWWRDGRRPRPFLAWLAGSAVGFALFIPWWPAFLIALENFSNVVFFTNRLRALLGLAEWPVSLYFVAWLAALLVAPLLVAAVWRLWERPSLARPAAWLLLAGFVAVTLFAPYPRLYSVKRLLTIGWPLVILFVAYVLTRRPAAVAPTLVGGLLLLSLAASLISLAVPKDDWRGAFAFLETRLMAGEEVWLDPAFDRILVDYYEPALNVRRTAVNRQVPDPAPPTIWLIAERFNPPSDTERWLDAQGTLLETHPLFRLELRHYVPPEQ